MKLRSAATLAFSLSMVVGCGGAAANGSTTNVNRGAAQSSCDMSAATVASWAPFHVPGSRVSVNLPGTARVTTGSVVYVLPECGASVGVVEVPPGLAEAREFEQGVENGVRGSASCTDGSLGIVCRDPNGIVIVGRWLRAQGASALVLGFASTEEQAATLAQGASIDASLPYDPVAAMGLRQPAPEGMTLHPLSNFEELFYAQPGANLDAAGTPVVVWNFEAGSDEEVGQALGVRLGSTLAVRDLSPVREVMHEGGAVLLAAQGMHGGVPVAVMLGIFRQASGDAICFVARVPQVDAEAWMPRFGRQAEATQLTR